MFTMMDKLLLYIHLNQYYGTHYQTDKETACVYPN